MSDSHKTVHIGAAQVAEVYLDREATIEKDVKLIHEAGHLGIDLLVFPEFHVPASPHWYKVDPARDRETFYKDLFDNSVTIPGPSIRKVRDAADEAGVTVVLGVNEKESNAAGSMYNTQVFIDKDGSLVGSRRKIVPTVDERLFHARGTGEDLTVFDSTVGTLGGLMCGEHGNPLAQYAILALGEEIHAASWTAFTPPVIWDEWCENREQHVGIRTRYHSLTGRVPVAAASSVVTQELIEGIGNPEIEPGGGISFITDSLGRYLDGPVFEGEQIVHAEVDLGDRVRGKATHDITGHYNRFDIFDLNINRDPQAPLSFREEK